MDQIENRVLPALRAKPEPILLSAGSDAAKGDVETLNSTPFNQWRD